jgi:hypothetical protein
MKVVSYLHLHLGDKYTPLPFFVRFILSHLFVIKTLRPSVTAIIIFPFLIY